MRARDGRRSRPLSRWFGARLDRVERGHRGRLPVDRGRREIDTGDHGAAAREAQGARHAAIVRLDV